MPCNDDHFAAALQYNKELGEKVAGDDSSAGMVERERLRLLDLLTFYRWGGLVYGSWLWGDGSYTKQLRKLYRSVPRPLWSMPSSVFAPQRQRVVVLGRSGSSSFAKSLKASNPDKEIHVRRFGSSADSYFRENPLRASNRVYVAGSTGSRRKKRGPSSGRFEDLDF